MTLSLFDDPKPPTVPGIDLRCCDVAEILAEARGAKLVHADPPWRYHRDVGDGVAANHYDLLSEEDIVRHLDAAFDCVDAGRLVCWYTWPKDAVWREAGDAGSRWGPRITGGAWVKVGGGGVGYHWRGHSEPVAVFTKGTTGRPNAAIRNSHVSRREQHSEKPLQWLRAMLRAWTDPGDLVVDVYAGLAPMARACMLEGRRYIGAEIDPDRHHQAMCRLALARE